MKEVENCRKINGFIGNEKVTNFFNHCLANGFPAQVFGVYGQRHVGKKHLVRCLTQSLKCADGINFFSLKPEEEKRDISIEQIRDWQKMLKYKAVNDNYIVGLIESGEALNLNSANALLKIIEEPPKNVLIFVCAQSSNSLLPTIQSRLFAVNLKIVNSDDLGFGLQSLGVEEKLIDKVISLAGGLPGLALKMINDENYLNSWETDVEQINKIMDGSMDKKLLWLNKFFEATTIDLKSFDLLSKIAFVVSEKARLNPEKYAHALAWLVESPKLIKGNVNQKLLIEKIILSL